MDNAGGVAVSAVLYTLFVRFYAFEVGDCLGELGSVRDGTVIADAVEGKGFLRVC